MFLFDNCRSNHWLVFAVPAGLQCLLWSPRKAGPHVKNSTTTAKITGNPQNTDSWRPLTRKLSETFVNFADVICCLFSAAQCNFFSKIEYLTSPGFWPTIIIWLIFENFFLPKFKTIVSNQRFSSMKYI